MAGGVLFGVEGGTFEALGSLADFDALKSLGFSPPTVGVSFAGFAPVET
jgi:hypothetical protein